MLPDTYLSVLGEMEDHYQDHLEPAYWREVGRRWFGVTAPLKTEDYGTEAWMRMGSLGILAELSGCHYRCRRFIAGGHRIVRPRSMELELGDFHDPVYDAVLDSFGYSVMLKVCVGLEGNDSRMFDWSRALEYSNPSEDNEQLLRVHWDVPGTPMGTMSCEIALRSAYNSWRMLR